MNNYLIPANSKRSLLIMGYFRLSDLILLGIGISISLILMLAIKGDEVWILVIKLLPLATGLLLVWPIPYYHNVVTFLTEVVLYVQSEKEYKWRGWCAYREFGDKK